MTRSIRGRQREGEGRFDRAYLECPEIEANDRLLKSFENRTWGPEDRFEKGEGYPYPCLRPHILNKQLDWLEVDIESVRIRQYYARQLESLKKPVSAEDSAFQLIRGMWNTLDRSFGAIDPPYNTYSASNPMPSEAIEEHMFKYSRRTLLDAGKLATKTTSLFDMSLWLKNERAPVNPKKVIYTLRVAVINKDKANSKLRPKFIAKREEIPLKNNLSEIHIKENIAKMHEIVASANSDDFAATEIQELVRLSKTTAVDILYFWQATINLIEVMLYTEGVTDLPRLKMPKPGLPKATPKATRPWEALSAKIYTQHDPGTSRLYP